MNDTGIKSPVKVGICGLRVISIYDNSVTKQQCLDKLTVAQLMKKSPEDSLPCS
jgi:hypothetical protein